MLKFVDADERDALRYYLGTVLDGLKKSVRFFFAGDILLSLVLN